MSKFSYNRNTPFGSLVGSLVSGTLQMQFLSSRLKKILENTADVDPNCTQLEIDLNLDKGTGKDFKAALIKIANTLDGLPEISYLDLG